MHIGLVGYKGAGKNLAAELIRKELPSYHVAAFADPLREVCQCIFGLSEAELHDRELKEEKLDRYPFQSPREIMQRLGTESIRTYWPEAWIEAWKRRTEGCPNTITTDVRFNNEADAIRARGGFLIRIVREGCHGDLHPSEALMSSINCDKKVVNDGSVNLLAARVLTALLELKEGK
jgi:hypothetical protein